MAAMRRYVLPFVSAVFLIWLGAVVVNHFLFNVADSAGAFCTETKAADVKKAGSRATVSIPFKTDDLCFATGVIVEPGAKYAVTMTVPEGSKWADHNFPTTPSGFRTADLGHWWAKIAMYTTMPLRRIIFRRWFTVIARIGTTGVYEDFLDPKKVGHNTYLGVTERTKRGGELFLYVNEAVVALPWVSKIFYKNNKGEARVEIRRLGG
jgi:hypothetical protein